MLIQLRHEITLESLYSMKVASLNYKALMCERSEISFNHCYGTV